jgi:hypothetical protein
MMKSSLWSSACSCVRPILYWDSPHELPRCARCGGRVYSTLTPQRHRAHWEILAGTLVLLGLLCVLWLALALFGGEPIEMGRQYAPK